MEFLSVARKIDLIFFVVQRIHLHSLALIKEEGLKAGNNNSSDQRKGESALIDKKN